MATGGGTCILSLLRRLNMDAAEPRSFAIAKQFDMLDDFAGNHRQRGGRILRGIYMAIGWTGNSRSDGNI